MFRFLVICDIGNLHLCLDRSWPDTCRRVSKCARYAGRELPAHGFGLYGSTPCGLIETQQWLP